MIQNYRALEYLPDSVYNAGKIISVKQLKNLREKIANPNIREQTIISSNVNRDVDIFADKLSNILSLFKKLYSYAGYAFKTGNVGGSRLYAMSGGVKNPFNVLPFRNREPIKKKPKLKLIITESPPSSQPPGAARRGQYRYNPEIQYDTLSNYTAPSNKSSLYSIPSEIGEQGSLYNSSYHSLYPSSSDNDALSEMDDSISYFSEQNYTPEEDVETISVNEKTILSPPLSENPIINILIEIANEIQRANTFFNGNIRKHISLLSQTREEEIQPKIDAIQNFIYQNIYGIPEVLEYFERDLVNGRELLRDVKDRFDKLKTDVLTATKSYTVQARMGGGSKWRHVPNIYGNNQSILKKYLL